VLGVEPFLEARERAFEIGSSRLGCSQALLHLRSHTFELGAGGLILIYLRLKCLVLLPQLCVGLALPAELGDCLVVHLGDVLVRIPRVGFAAPECVSCSAAFSDARRSSETALRSTASCVCVSACARDCRRSPPSPRDLSLSRSLHLLLPVLVFQRPRLRVETIEFLSRVLSDRARSSDRS
jgi:hypothetical protein